MCKRQKEFKQTTIVKRDYKKLNKERTAREKKRSNK